MIRSIYFFILFYSLNSFSNILPKDFGYKDCNQYSLFFLRMKIYDVSLCYDNKSILNEKEIYKNNFSIIIKYDKNVSSEKIVKSSISRIIDYSRIKKIEQGLYSQKLYNIFPNVAKGDIIEARYEKIGDTSFYHNKKFIGKITNKKFSMTFLNIWLEKENKYPEMPKALLNNE